MAEKFEVVVDTREKIESTNFALLWFFSKVSTSVFGFGKRRDFFSLFLRVSFARVVIEKYLFSAS